MPENTVLEGFDQQRNFKYKNYMGKKVIVETQESGKGVIVQLLSTDPNDFLNQNLYPGKEIGPESYQDI